MGPYVCILDVKPLSDGRAFGKDFPLERDWLIRGTEYSLAGDSTRQGDEFRRIRLVLCRFEFAVEFFLFGFVANILQLFVKDADLRIRWVRRRP